MESPFVESVSLATVEILGEKTAFQIFKEMGVFSLASSDCSRFSLEKLGGLLAQRYDSQIALGLMIRVGRASLLFLRRFIGEIAVLGKIDNRLKPIDQRFPESLQALAGQVSKGFSTQVEMGIAQRLQYDWQLQGEDLEYSPYYFLGLLEEFCDWLDARRDYRIAYAPSDNPDVNACLSIAIVEKE